MVDMCIADALVTFWRCPETDISAAVQSSGVKFCSMVELCPGRDYSPSGGDILRASKWRVKNQAGWAILGLSDIFRAL